MSSSSGSQSLLGPPQPQPSRLNPTWTRKPIGTRRKETDGTLKEVLTAFSLWGPSLRRCPWRMGLGPTCLSQLMCKLSYQTDPWGWQVKPSLRPSNYLVPLSWRTDSGLHICVVELHFLGFSPRRFDASKASYSRSVRDNEAKDKPQVSKENQFNRNLLQNLWFASGTSSCRAELKE